MSWRQGVPGGSLVSIVTRPRVNKGEAGGGEVGKELEGEWGSGKLRAQGIDRSRTEDPNRHGGETGEGVGRPGPH